MTATLSVEISKTVDTRYEWGGGGGGNGRFYAWNNETQQVSQECIVQLH